MGRGAGDDDDAAIGGGKRVEWVKERLLSTFPKLAGAKFVQTQNQALLPYDRYS